MLRSIIESIWSIIVSFLSIFLPHSWTASLFTNRTTNDSPSVAVIGCGIGGIAVAVKLKRELGLTAQIFEDNPKPGGVWLTNTYPGCAADNPSHLFSFSFEPNPNWSELFVKQKETLEYLDGIVQKYGILSKAFFNTTVLRTTWVDGRNQWKLEYCNKADKQVKTAFYDFVFVAIGPLNRYIIPDEFKTFRGEIIHTANWPKNVDLRNKRVAVVGNGASAVQVIAALQKICSQLILYQRSAAWVIPKPNFKYSEWIQRFSSWFPSFMLLQRFAFFLPFDLFYTLFVRDRESAGAKWIRRTLTRLAEKWSVQAKRPDLLKFIVPDYPFMCKLPILSSEYFPALCGSNVKVKMGNILSINGKTIQHSDRSSDTVDTLVLATGFEATDFFGNLQVIGRNNLHLHEVWKEEYPSTFQCIHVHGCPNMFRLLGPNSITPSSAFSLNEIEAAAGIRAIKYVLKNNLGALEVSRKAQDEWTTKVRAGLQGKTAFTGNCTSWWKNKDGEVVSMFPGSFAYLWWVTRRTDFSRDFIPHPKKG